MQNASGDIKLVNLISSWVRSQGGLRDVDMARKHKGRWRCLATLVCPEAYMHPLVKDTGDTRVSEEVPHSWPVQL